MTGQDDAGRPPAIAVIGLSGRFPGAASPTSLWTNLRDGVESITFFSDEQLLAAGESPSRLHDPAYVKACGRLDGIADFDAGFFGMSPRDAAVFDPQHRLFLECAWEAFEHAGYVGERVKGPVGVFAATGAPEYLMHNLLQNRQVMDSVGAWLVRHTGNDQNFLATRVSYELNLRGPSLNAQTACSASLTAVHLACQSLLNGECDVALAGGSTVYPEQNRGYMYKEGEILSPDGHCRAFDAQSAGSVMASAVGCVVLKRLEDARRDGDHVLAIVRGSAVNNDGSDKVGYLAPSVSGQARVVSEALAMAGVHPDDVSYIEAHGTGTLIGDPIEITALTQAFRAHTSRTQYCAIGSLKTNIGHSGEAAGVCGFIKTVLALHHREIPPSLNFHTPNPQAELPTSPFFVNTALRPWTVAPGKTRIAGVTALGAGGTNVHVILEEAPTAAAATETGGDQLLVLSARTPAALESATERLAAHLRAHPDMPLADVAHTLLDGRKAFPHRRAVAVRSTADAVSALDGPDRKRLATGHHALPRPPALCFMFPGGGAQYAGMGADLYAREPRYRAAFDEALGHLAADLRADVRALVLPGGDTAARADASRRLEAPSRALPALLATEYALAQLLRSWGLVPAAMIGHSAGEYAAACLAGVMSLGEAMSVVALRGRLFESLDEGGMLSVQLPAERARVYMTDDLSIAADNAPGLCVLSGPVGAIAQAEQRLRDANVDCTRVHINVAAHSTMVEPILAEFERFCRTLRLRPPAIPFLSNVTGAWIADAEATDPAYWVRHLRSTVRFAAGADTLLAGGPTACVEVGPGRTLTSLMRQQQQKPTQAVSSLRHPDEAVSDVTFLLSAVGRLWTAGVDLDAQAFGGDGRRRVALPTYPFERQRFWVDPDRDGLGRRDAGLHKRADIAEWFSIPSWARSAPPPPDGAAGPATWLVFTDESTLARDLVGHLRRSGHRVVEAAVDERFERAGSQRYRLDPGNREHFDALAAALLHRGESPERLLHLWALAPPPARTGHAWRPGRDALARYREALSRHYFSLLYAAQTFCGDGGARRLDCVTSRVQPVAAGDDVDPERAVLLGPCKVIPREFPQVTCVSVDVAWPQGAAGHDLAVERIVRELHGPGVDNEVALRGRDRWVRRFDAVRLEPSASRPWLRPGGVYVITGGLGGIALRVAEHLAASGPVKLALIGRSAIPPPQDAASWVAAHGEDDITSRRLAAVARLRARGAEVLTIAADVGDIEAMRRALTQVRGRFGGINGVFHAAGVLKDQIIALRDAARESEVLDAKVKGALVLDELFHDEPLDVLVLFSSVSSLLGLPGQAEYTAANSFLDALAHARSARGAGRTVSINWNAWQDVGMLAGQVQQLRAAPASTHRPAAPRRHPAVTTVVSDEPRATVFRASLSRANCWVVGEHVVHGGDALLPGTGFLDFVRAAFDRDPHAGPIELRDVLFLAPFTVPPEGLRDLHIRLERGGSGAFSCYAESAEEPLVVGTVREIAPAPHARGVDLDAIRARCATPGAAADGRLLQPFMDFGPRWANVARIDLGAGEALITLALPEACADDVRVFRLHPALLDMATGAAQAIVPGFDPASTFNVPFAYGRIVVHRPLPAQVVSHVRLRNDGGREAATFDVTLYDERGDELVTIERFVMKRVTGAFAAPRARAAEPERPRGPQSASEAALREGMTPAEGLDALDRMLAVDFAPQIVACTVPLERWLEQLAARRETGLGNGLDGGGPVFSRPSVSAAFAEPRDDVERELAAMWCALLGIDALGINDDFFELGGQSLVAVRLFQRISKQYGVDLPLATLFQAPTIAECATLVRSALGRPEPDAGGDAGPAPEPARAEAPGPPAAAPAFKSLVAIQKGQGRAPLFIVHGAGGNVLNFRDLSRAMGPAQPVYGLQASGIDGVSPLHRTIEDMASAYVAEARVVQPHGPYFLAGYSGGGIVAFEMARRLTAEGERIGMLAFIDTFHPHMPLNYGNMFNRLERLRREGVSYVRGVLDKRRRSAQEARDERAIEEHLAAGSPVPFELRELHLMRSFERAARQYHPAPWSGTATLFRAEEVDYFFQAGGPAYGWDKDVLGGVDVVTIPGDHNTLLLGANAERIVGLIERLMRDAMVTAASGG